MSPLAYPKPLPPPPTVPGEFILSMDGKSWDQVPAAAESACAAEQATPADQFPPGDL
jgi:hypothetical protein